MGSGVFSAGVDIVKKTPERVNFFILTNYL